MKRFFLFGLVGLACAVSACAGREDATAARQQEVADDPAAMMRIAAAAETSNDYAAAQTFYGRALELDGNLAPASLGQARVMARQGDLDGALAKLRDAHRLHPDDAAIATALGRMLATLHRPAEALTVFDEGLRSSAGSAPLMVGRGVVLDVLGRHGEAQAAYEAALRIDPDNAAASKDLGLSRSFGSAAPKP